MSSAGNHNNPGQIGGGGGGGGGPPKYPTSFQQLMAERYPQRPDAQPNHNHSQLQMPHQYPQATNKMTQQRDFAPPNMMMNGAFAPPPLAPMIPPGQTLPFFGGPTPPQ